MIKKITLSAAIAALYVALTFVFLPVSFGPIQFRVAEALTLLPFFIPEAIVGLFAGCVLSNLMGGGGGFGLIDVVFGSGATLLAAWLTYKSPNIWVAAIPPVLINALVVGYYIAAVTEVSVVLTMLYIGISQFVVCFGVGLPLSLLLYRSRAFDTILLSKKEIGSGTWVKK